MRRVRSPSTGSTFTTSAPKSASSSPHEGPITVWQNSTTRTPSKGRFDTAFWLRVERGLACGARRATDAAEAFPQPVFLWRGSSLYVELDELCARSRVH